MFNLYEDKEKGTIGWFGSNHIRITLSWSIAESYSELMTRFEIVVHKHSPTNLIEL